MGNGDLREPVCSSSDKEKAAAKQPQCKYYDFLIAIKNPLQTYEAYIWG